MFRRLPYSLIKISADLHVLEIISTFQFANSRYDRKLQVTLLFFDSYNPLKNLT